MLVGDLFEVVSHFVMDHIPTVWLFLILFDCLEDERYIILWSPIWRREVPVSVQLACCIHVICYRCMAYALALDGFSL